MNLGLQTINKIELIHKLMMSVKISIAQHCLKSKNNFCRLFPKKIFCKNKSFFCSYQPSKLKK